jgi:hypothetical protein
LRFYILLSVAFISTGCLQKTQYANTTGDASTAPGPAARAQILYPTGAGVFVNKARLVAQINAIEDPLGTYEVAIDGGGFCSGKLSTADTTGVINVDCRTPTRLIGSHKLTLNLYRADGTLSSSDSRTVRSATDACAGSVPSSGNPTPPTLLSQTCLYDDIATQKLSESVRSFTPSYNLFGDSAVKRRWIYLPPGTQIDTSDPDNWVFPAGTKFFKEFRHDGRLVETRMLTKIAAAAGAASWVATVYAWRLDGTEADINTAAVANALNTIHDIPATANCGACHNGTKDFVLGFDATQMSHPSPTYDEVSFATLRGEALINTNPGHDYTIPGTPAQQKAIGYLHANCSHCHDPLGSQAALGINFRHSVTTTVHTNENAYVTGLAQAKFIAGDAANSRIVIRMSARPGMPPIGTKLVDSAGLAIIREWILGL